MSHLPSAPFSVIRRLASLLRGSVVAGALLAALAGAGALSAQEPAESAAPALGALFPHRAALTAPGGRLARLLLPPEVLSACRDDLADLRIVDVQGREVPYVVDGGRAPGEAIEVLETRWAELLGADRQTIGREHAPPLLREAYELAAPPASSSGEGWDLVVVTDRERFVRRITVAAAEEGGGSDGSGGGRVLAEGSVYRLSAPDGAQSAERRTRRERLRLALPSPLAAATAEPGGEDGRTERFVVTLEGEGSPFLEPSFRYERSRRLPGLERTRVPLATLTQRSADGRTVVELSRPRGLVPDLLVLGTTTPALSRTLEVWDDGPGAVDGALGGGTVFRLPTPGTNTRGGKTGELAVEELEIPLAPGRGDRLRVVILNGDSPPLEKLTFEAAVRRPALLFSLPGDLGTEPSEASAELLFGGGRAYAPRYDLGALLAALPTPGRSVAGQGAELGERLVDPLYLADAHLGTVEANPRFDPSPALSFAHRPGARVDARLFRFRRALHVDPSPDGLARLPLSPEDLARARPDLADLRVVDADERQWAYLVEDNIPTALIDLPVARRDGDRPATSRYELTLPAQPATLDRIVLEIDAPFFDRPFVLTGLPDSRRNGEPKERELARGRLHRRPGDPRPVTVAFPRSRVESLFLDVEDGSDAPLPIVHARGRFPLPELYFPAPEGDYALLLGDPEAKAPSYELARARKLVLAVAAAPAEAGALEGNPAYRTGLRLLSGGGLQQLLLWSALVIAVVVLALFTLRLARGA